MNHNSDDQPTSPVDTRTDAEKFEDAMQSIFSAPKEEVDAHIEKKKTLKRQEVKKQTEQK